MEKTPREKFDERLRQAVYEPDYSTPNTIDRERLYMLKEERGYDEYFDDFVKTLTESIGDDPEAYHTPKELEESLAAFEAAHAGPKAADCEDRSTGAAPGLEKPAGKRLFARTGFKRVTSLAAAFLLVFAVVGFFAGMLGPDTAEAEKNRNKVVEEQGDTAVVREEFDSDLEMVGYKEWETTVWEEVKKYKKFLPELLIPEYISADYIFDRLRIEKYKTGEYLVEYRFKKGDKELYISQREATDEMKKVFVSEEGQAISTQKGKLEIKTQEFEEYRLAILTTDEIQIRINSVSGDLSDDEFKKIVEGLV